jgi:CW_7 repeat
MTTEPVSSPEPQEQVPEESPDLSANEQIAREVLAGYWGRGLSRNKKLEEAGYDVSKINAEITKILNQR